MARRRGSTLTMVALSIVVLLGFTALVVDYGFLTTDANRLQRACDAAALAGVSQLHKTDTTISNRSEIDVYNAKKMAYDVALLNGVTLDWNNIVVSNNNTRLRVTAITERSFFFAPVLGINSGLVSRSATAGVFPVTQISTSGPARAAPMGITWETYNSYYTDRNFYHPLELIRQNKSSFGKDDLVLFDLREQNSKSGAQMQRQLTGEVTEYVAIGDYETTLNSALASEKRKLTDGLDEIFRQSAAAPWYDAGSGQAGVRYFNILNGTSLRSNPRVVYLIVTPGTTSSSNGTFNTQVQGLAPVYLESYEYETVETGSGNNKNSEEVLRVRVRFLPHGEVSGAPGIDTGDDSTTTISGARVLRLLE